LAPGRAIREAVFTGTHFERGLERGRRLKETLSIPEPPDLSEGFVEGCRAAAEALHPPALEEFEGLLRGGGFDRRAMAAYYFARLESRLGGCTMFAVAEPHRDAGRGPIVGRNYDWAVADLRWCELQRCLPADGLRRIGYTHNWAGCADVLNEAGLYVAIASLPPEPVLAPGVQWSILVETISETCAGVDEAVCACARVRHLRPMSYLLADARGEVAVVEATPREVRVRWPEGGIVVAANVPQGGEVVAQSPPGEGQGVLAAAAEYSPDSVARAERRVEVASGMLREAAPAVSEETVRRVLTDHTAPVCTGDHGQPDGGTWATIWSGVCMPAEGDFCIAPGLPCRFDYRCFRIAGALTRPSVG